MEACRQKGKKLREPLTNQCQRVPAGQRVSCRQRLNNEPRESLCRQASGSDVFHEDAQVRFAAPSSGVRAPKVLVGSFRPNRRNKKKRKRPKSYRRVIEIDPPEGSCKIPIEQNVSVEISNASQQNLYQTEAETLL